MQNPAQQLTPSIDPILLQTNMTQAMLLWQRFVARLLGNAMNKPANEGGQGDNSFAEAIAKWGVNLLLHPTAVMQANMDLFSSQTKLWQHTTTRALGLGHLSPGVPDITDKRFNTRHGKNTSSPKSCSSLTSICRHTGAHWHKPQAAFQNRMRKKPSFSSTA